MGIDWQHLVREELRMLRENGFRKLLKFLSRRRWRYRSSFFRFL
jgi:hypothetical protein